MYNDRDRDHYDRGYGPPPRGYPPPHMGNNRPPPYDYDYRQGPPPPRYNDPYDYPRGPPPRDDYPRGGPPPRDEYRQPPPPGGGFHPGQQSPLAKVPQAMFVMPEGWEPGQPMMIPDPDDPTGKRMIQVPAEALQVMAEVPKAPPAQSPVSQPSVQQQQPQPQQQPPAEEKKPEPVPQIGADVDVDSAQQTGPQGKKKKKKKPAQLTEGPSLEQTQIEESLSQLKDQSRNAKNSTIQSVGNLTHLPNESDIHSQHSAVQSNLASTKNGVDIKQLASFASPKSINPQSIPPAQNYRSIQPEPTPHYAPGPPPRRDPYEPYAKDPYYTRGGPQGYDYDYDRRGPPPPGYDYDRRGPPPPYDYDRRGPPPLGYDYDRRGPPPPYDYDRRGPPPPYHRDDPYYRDDRNHDPYRYDLPGPPKKNMTEEEKRALALERITNQVNQHYRQDSFRKSEEDEESSYYDSEEEAEIERQMALQKKGAICAPGEGEDVIKIVPWGEAAQPPTTGEGAQLPDHIKERGYDPAWLGEMKELTMCDLITIEIKHYLTKFANSKCYKRFEQTGFYKGTAKCCKKSKKAMKKKIQGEFYVDSDPEKEEIKNHVDTQDDNISKGGNITTENAIEGKEQDVVPVQEPEISKPLTIEQKQQLKYELVKNALYTMRVFGSLIALIDIFAKIAYYDYSKFASIHIQQIYLFFLYLRPIMISIVILYNFLIGVKIICQSRRNKQNKKFVDDTENIENQELQTAKVKQNIMQKYWIEWKHKDLCSSMMLLTFKHISLLFISYTGFIRLMEDDKMIKLPMIIGHGFELFSQTIPLIMIQALNNHFINKWQKPLDSMNLHLSILNIVDLILELILVQIVQNWDIKEPEASEAESKDSFVGTKVGIVLPESMLNGSSDQKEENVKKTKKKKKMKNYLKKLEREKREMEIKKTFGLDLRAKMEKKTLKQKFKIVVGHPLCLIFNIGLCSLIIWGGTADQGLYIMQTCGKSFYEDDLGFCQDCLPALNDPFCTQCDDQFNCNSCLNPRVLSKELDNDTSIEYTFCKTCDHVHGDACQECTQESCLKCSGTFYLSNGVCEDCEARPGCQACDETGCIECEEGWYMNNSTQECEKCSSAPLGGECSKCYKDEEDVLKCSLCANETHYSLHEDGKCKFNCLQGMIHTDELLYDQCRCPTSEYMTEQGCKSCNQGIPSCSRCSESKIFTQVPLIDSLLQPTDKYLQCSTCDGQSDQTGGMAMGNNVTQCLSCGQIEAGCLNCQKSFGNATNVEYTCTRCARGFYQYTRKEADPRNAGKQRSVFACRSCEYITEFCGQCQNLDKCEACIDGYNLILGKCYKKWFDNNN